MFESSQSIFYTLACAGAGISTALIAWILTRMYGSFDVSRFARDESTEREEAPFLLRCVLPYASAAGSAILGGIGENRFLVRKYREKISKMILMAGDPAGLTPSDMVGLSVVGAVVGTVCAAVIYSMVGKWGGALLLFGSVTGIVLPQVWINDRIKTRQIQIRRGLPYCLDLMTLAVESGMDFTTALQIVGERLRVKALAVELRRTIRAIQMGKVRSEALRDLSNRVALPDLSSVTAAIVQADEFGADLAPILRIQSEQIRTRRFQQAEKLAMEAPVKMLLPLVAFFFPTTLIVIFGPIAAAYLSRSLR
jgi:tight adherence protein C